MTNLNHYAVFLAVAEARSFTRAAERLGTDKGHVSRVVSALEESLGVVLLARTTRSVTLTPAGEDLAASVARPLADLERVSKSLVDRPVTPSGLVTLAAPPDIGRTVVAPLLPAFRTRFPAVRLRLVLADALVPLADAKADVALRVGKVGEGGVKARRLGELEAAFFAAPRYIAARGAPKEPRDLGAHDGLWPARSRKKSFATDATPPPPAIECDDFGALLALARAGGGVALLPLHLAQRDVAEGALVRVVPEVVLRGAPLFLVTAKERPLPPRTAALRDFLVEHLPTVLASTAGRRPRAAP